MAGVQALLQQALPYSLPLVPGLPPPLLMATLPILSSPLHPRGLSCTLKRNYINALRPHVLSPISVCQGPILTQGP